jgi:hypothetical protein
VFIISFIISAAISFQLGVPSNSIRNVDKVVLLSVPHSCSNNKVPTLFSIKGTPSATIEKLSGITVIAATLGVSQEVTLT